MYYGYTSWWDEDLISNAGNRDQDDVIVLDTDKDNADDNVNIIEDDDDYLRPRQTRRAAGSNGEKQRFEDRYGDMKPGKVLSMLFVFPTVSRIETYQTPCRLPVNEVAFPVYNHFNPPQIIRKNDKIYHRFTCKR